MDFPYVAQIKCRVRGFMGDGGRRFRMAQTLFIFSICFGWYLPDLLRRVSLFAALLLTKGKRRDISTDRWDSFTKFAMVTLCVFLAWVILDPMLFGDEALAERLKGVARPIEVALWVYGVMLYARDDFFVKRMSALSISSGIFFATVSFIQRAYLGFAKTDEIEWVLCKYTLHAGMIILALLPWLFYKLTEAGESRRRKQLLAAGIIEMVIVAVLTYYLTIMVSLAAQLLFIVPYMLSSREIRHSLSLKNFSLALLVLICVFSAAMCVKDIKKEVFDQYRQLSMINRDFSDFTTKRDEIWTEAMDLVRLKKATGFGWVDYYDYSKIRKPHPHSSYIEAAFHTGMLGALLYFASIASLFIAAAKKIVVDKDRSAVPFVVVSILILFAVAGSVESFFYVRRQIMIPFWSTACLVFAPVMCEEKKTNPL